MTLEEFKRKYDWAEEISAQQMRKFTVFFMMLHVKISVMRDGESMKEFMEDLREIDD